MLREFTDFLQLSFNSQTFWLALIVRLSAFMVGVLLAILLGRWTPAFIHWTLQRLLPTKALNLYEQFIAPLRSSLTWTGTWLLVAISLELVTVYPGLYRFLKFFVYLGLTVCTAWLASQAVKQVIRLYVPMLMRWLGRELEDILRVFETIANLIIGGVAVVIFARSQNFYLMAILLGFGISGAAVAFAAREVLSQLFGTLVLYLDRPYSPGEYIRVSLNQLAEDIYGRVESIGLRSTKIRAVGKNTLIIVPNSVMASKMIVNVTRGKKVMALLYFDFSHLLQVDEQALVKQVIEESLDQLFGIDPGSTRMDFFKMEDLPGTRVRLTFFIVGSNEDSIKLRKQLSEVSQERIAQQLQQQNLDFAMEEPTLYVDSPITL